MTSEAIARDHREWIDVLEELERSLEQSRRIMSGLETDVLLRWTVPSDMSPIPAELHDRAARLLSEINAVEEGMRVASRDLGRSMSRLDRTIRRPSGDRWGTIDTSC